MTSPVDIRPDQLEIVQDILLKHLPADAKVWVFGSRANWTTKDSSDLDLALEGESKLSHKVLGALKDAFEDSALPYTVDVVDLNRIGDSFRQIVESQRVLLSEEGAATKGSSLAGSNGHWRRAALGDLIDLQLSSVDKKSKANEQAVQLCNYTDVYNNSFIYAGMDFMPATATEREIARCSLAAGDVVITKSTLRNMTTSASPAVGAGRYSQSGLWLPLGNLAAAGIGNGWGLSILRIEHRSSPTSNSIRMLME